MRERPILMSGPMALACHNGTKTMTRRVVKPQPPEHVDALRQSAVDPAEWIDRDGINFGVCCPYGVPGDRLWVRETFVEIAGRAWHRAGGNLHWNGEPYTGRWTPSIHMPRWACRTVLEITDVRVERLQEITDADAVAEGFTASMMHPQIVVMCEDGGTYSMHGDAGNDVPRIGDGDGGRKVVHVQHVPASVLTTAREMFAVTWRTIYGADSWSANPWVWVVSFKKVLP